MNLYNLLSTFLCLCIGVLILPTRATYNIMGYRGPNRIWPEDDDEPGMHTIYYCFFNEDSKNHIQPHLEAAWRLWMDALGEPGVDHSIDWQPWMPDDIFDKNRRFCYGPNWSDNPEVPDGTLMIHETPYTMSSSLGWVPLGQGEDPQNKLRHNMQFVASVGDGRDAGHFAHEMGHVMGLMHEHQRPDRDSYIYYMCQNLHDYDHVRQHLAAGDSINNVCTDRPTALRYKDRFTSWDYAKYPEGGWWSHDYYDLASIMHYESSGNAQSITDCQANAGKCPIAQWNADRQTISPIRWYTQPSNWDAYGIKMMYPAPQVPYRKRQQAFAGDDTTSMESPSSAADSLGSASFPSMSPAGMSASIPQNSTLTANLTSLAPRATTLTTAIKRDGVSKANWDCKPKTYMCSKDGKQTGFCDEKGNFELIRRCYGKCTCKMDNGQPKCFKPDGTPEWPGKPHKRGNPAPPRGPKRVDMRADSPSMQMPSIDLPRTASGVVISSFPGHESSYNATTLITSTKAHNSSTSFVASWAYLTPTTKSSSQTSSTIVMATGAPSPGDGSKPRTIHSTALSYTFPHNITTGTASTKAYTSTALELTYLTVLRPTHPRNSTTLATVTKAGSSNSAAQPMVFGRGW